MSWFGDLWVKERNAVEAAVATAWAAVEPEVRTLAVAAIQTGVESALAKGGSVGDQWVAARNAAESIIAANGKAVAADALHALTAGAVVSAQTPSNG